MESVAVTTKSQSKFDPQIWVDEHGDYLYAFAFSRLRDKSAAEDLVQETLLAAIQFRDSYAGGASERTWLTGILKHKIVDYYRRSSREAELSEEESDMSAYDYLFRSDSEWKGHWTAEARPTRWQENPEEALEHAEFREILAHCLSELPERVANVFTMREMDGFESREICDILSISPNNFWVMMHRARLHLRRCLDFNWFRKREN